MLKKEIVIRAMRLEAAGIENQVARYPVQKNGESSHIRGASKGHTRYSAITFVVCGVRLRIGSNETYISIGVIASQYRSNAA
jgi:hypothetical protein